jgi:hypothetical protein
VDDALAPSGVAVSVRCVSQGFDVDLDVLRAHARRLDRVADAVDGARRRAPHLTGQAFGVLCAFLPAAVRVLECGTREALTASGEVVDDTADEVRRMVAAYRRCDDDVADLLGRLA